MEKRQKIEERQKVLNEILRDLDDCCSFILATITIPPKEIGFNELHRKIKKYPRSPYNKMAKSSLSEHIQHLLERKLIEKKIVKNSRLKLKPSKYKLSQHFINLSTGIIPQATITTPEDFLPLMRAEDARTVTVNLMKVVFSLFPECLKTMIQSPEDIAIYNMHQLFYVLEILMRAYRQRIQERKEEAIALKTIDEWLSNIVKA